MSFPVIICSKFRAFFVYLFQCRVSVQSTAALLPYSSIQRVSIHFLLHRFVVNICVANFVARKQNVSFYDFHFFNNYRFIETSLRSFLIFRQKDLVGKIIAFRFFSLIKNANWRKTQSLLSLFDFQKFFSTTTCCIVFI